MMTNKAMMKLFVMALFFILPQAASALSTSGLVNGDPITSITTFTFAEPSPTIVIPYTIAFRRPASVGNRAPTDIIIGCTVEPSCTGGLIIENTVGAVLGNILVSDPDEEDAHEISVIDDIRFEVVDGQLRLAEGESINFEEEPTIVITISAVDPEGRVFEKQFTIIVRDVNEAPMDVVISNSYVPPGEAGAAIGTITFTDEDVDDEHTIEVVDDDRFVIVDGVLTLAEGVSLGENEQIDVRVRVRDIGGLEAVLTVTVTTVTPATPSSIEFLALDATGSETQVSLAVCQPPASTQESGATSLRRNLNPGNISGPQIVDIVDAYAVGDPAIISVTDSDQNFRPLFRETVEVTVATLDGSDQETVLLTESDVNTGVFVGYVFTTSQTSQSGDCVLTVVSRESIEAVYIDPTDDSDIKTTTAVISPVGIVFNDQTGEPIDGIILTLIDVSNGEPADVRGDGSVFSEYPSSVRSGENITDASGIDYPYEKGEYRFPAIPDGEYRIELFNAKRWRISDVPDEELQRLGASTALTPTSEGPFALNNASRGLAVHISQGALPRIDIPLTEILRENPPASTSSNIEFLQYSANPAVGSSVDVGQTMCVSAGINNVTELKGVPVPVPGIVNLVPATAYKAGQPIFIRVTDADQNADPAVRESVTVQLDVAATGDREYLELLETGPNTGVFVGYIQTEENEESTASCTLGVRKNQPVIGSYGDAFDSADTSESTVLIDPSSRVFSSRDGRLIDGVSVSLIDNASGQLAEVFGDGPAFARFPNPIISGSQVTDDANVAYNFSEGVYRFPFVNPGAYTLRLEDLPDGVTYPSAASDETIQSLPGAPFQIVSGSRGSEFEVPVGPALYIDVPLDEPFSELFISKVASKSIVAIGDFLKYSVTVQNKSTRALVDSKISDVLPKGFRYQKGSLRLASEKIGNPTIASDGRSMLIDLPNVEDGSITVSYVVEVTPAAEVGAAINFATVIGASVAASNTASAKVMVKNDLFRDKAILVGKVFLKQCLEPSSGADSTETTSDTVGSIEVGTGVAGVRLFLEDGSYVITDENGMWHLEGIEPGSHVVQLDVESLESRYEVSPCNANSRFAGSAYSQFVDVQGGTLWRADFAIQEKSTPESQIELTQTVKSDEDGFWVSVKAENKGPVAVSSVKAIYSIPNGWEIKRASEVLDGKKTSHVSSIVGAVWNMGELTAPTHLRFQIQPKARQISRPAQFTTNNQVAMLQPKFSTRSIKLSGKDRADLDALVQSWKQREWELITVVGHTDNVPIAPVNRKEFANNMVLSEARALAVAQYISNEMKQVAVKVKGAGAQYPIASNSTANGRSQNRRVEILLKEKIIVETQVADAKVLNGNSVVRLSFKSAGTPRGRTESSDIPLNRLAGGFDLLEATTQGIALGSWDLIELSAGAESFARDKNVQGLINIKDGDRFGHPIKSIRLDLDSRLRPKLLLDGVEVSKDRIGFKLVDPNTGKTVYKYIGIDFGDPGAHTLELVGSGSFGNVRFSEKIEVVVAGALHEVKVLETSGNIADGHSPVTVKLGLYDKHGEPLNTPYKLLLESNDLQRYNRNLSLTQLTEISDDNFVDVSPEGNVKFNPVAHSGVYRAMVIFGDLQTEREIEVFVQAEKREWIMVGLAEGSVAQRKLSGNMQAIKDAGIDDEFDTEGRIAFYAKGRVKGEFVLTLAYDSDKEKLDALEQTIDPNSFYTLYGDRTSTLYDAASQEKLFLKLEKGQLYALFGDYTTGLSVTELASYSRSFTGLKTEYRGEKLEVTAFAAETDQAFIKDEIRGDGTSGLYRLTSSDLVINSEKVTVEVRDRFHTQDILETRTFTRHLDYNIDYDAGTLFFKQPIFSQDTAFNPVFIVVDYETTGDGRDELNIGGRVAYKPTTDIEVGATYIKEGVSRRNSDLAGIDLKYQINDSTELRAEYARSDSEIDEVDYDGSAYLVEIEHRSGKLGARAYVREQEGAFGLGQQNASESGTRKIGVDGTYQMSDEVEIKGEAYRETDLASGNNQDVVTSSMQYRGDNYSLNTGVRSARNDSGDGSQQSNQLLVGGRYQLLDGKVAVSANADTPIGGKGEADNFPKRLRVGLDYKISEKITLKAEQEFSWGEDLDSQKTRIGMSSDLWEGGQLVTSFEQSNEENGQRLAAVAGLKHRWALNEQWSFDFGLDRSQTLKSERDAPDLQVTTVFSSPDNNDFTSVTFGSNFRRDAWDWSTRVEYRAADTEDRFNFISDVIHNLDDGKQILANVNYQKTNSDTVESTNTDIRLGYSFRPTNSRWTLFNRLDLSHSMTETAGSEFETQKIVNNLNANYLWGDNTQIALQYGAKYVIDTFDNDDYKGFTDLYGVEVRHDVNKKWDVGFQGSLYNSWNSNISDYSYGVSVGYNMARNMWMSLGYNFSGFDDDDFSAAEYTSRGVYLKYRLKFDQHTAKSILGLMRK